MDQLATLFQITIALGIINVWFLRASLPTAYRGLGSQSLRDEFSAYGLPTWFMYIIWFLKSLAALGLIVGLWLPVTVLYSAYAMAILMIGALFMHIKVKDAPKKSLPALIILCMCIFVVVSYSKI